MITTMVMKDDYNVDDDDEGDEKEEEHDNDGSTKRYKSLP